MRKIILAILIAILIIPTASVGHAEPSFTPARGTNYDLDGVLRTFPIAQYGDRYYLYDMERNIIFYDASGIDESEKAIHDYTQYPLLVSASPDEWPTHAITYYIGVAMVYDYYANMFQHVGPMGGGEPLRVVIDASGSNGALAYTTFIKVFKSNNMPDLVRTVEDMGQEYTHMVIGNTARMASTTTSRSINEAFAISMGLLISNEMNGVQPKGRWLYSSNMDFGNPLRSGNAVELDGENYDASAGVVSWQTYRNAGIFMNIVHGLWEGGVDDDGEIARLIYHTYMEMGEGRPDDRVHEYDWSEVRACAMLAAKKLGWPDERMEMMAKLFDRAKIPENNLPFSYRVDGGEVTITGYRSPVAREMQIPPQIEGLPVTGIANHAFVHNMALESVVIPDSVERIGDAAFYACAKLTRCVLPQNLKIIPKQLFGACENLRTVVVPETVTEIGEIAFGGCASLSTLVLPEGLQSLGWYAFGGCTNLLTIRIPGAIQKIETHTFGNCASLKSVYLPASVASIDASAFAGYQGAIHGEPGSHAEAFAGSQRIPFVAH